LLWGCSASQPASGFSSGSGGSGGATSVNIGGAGTSGTSSGGAAASSGTSGVVIDTPDAGDAGDAGRPPRCDDAGRCTCINIASLGRPAHYDETDAFQEWINTQSSASFDLLVDRQPITAELLAPYDIVILQALEDKDFGPFWQMTQSETDALATWVQAGGGLISLTGYEEDSSEITPTNQLLSFTGISYNPDNILNGCLGTIPCSCWGSAMQVTGWQAASPISANIEQVGAFRGHSINAGDATIVAHDEMYNFAVSKEMGKGKVFVFSDEWVTFTSQWLGTGQQQTIDMTSQCYDAANNRMLTADKVFQVPQFWYNVIKWASPLTQCDFTIDNDTIVK
ncbi:MAG TPA: hypothetical protein VGP93_05535, partial [Polyangiaceae bacterium]|nr:hypothetical protein [Polyangiaceae bacterium]